MNKRLLLFELISLFLAFNVNAQIVTKYEQGFESSGETSSYTVVQGSVAPVTNVASTGSRSLKLQHTSQEAIIMLDTIDFTDNGSFQFFYLEFMHICDVDPQTTAATNSVAIIDVKRIDEANWTTLNGSDYYDNSWGGGSEGFVGNSTFTQRSYPIWRGANMNNTWWKRERFKLALRLSQAPLQNRKLLIRFHLKPRTAAGATNAGWYLDNVKVQCSPNSMLLPVINMVDYPDLTLHPNSRGAHIAADFYTPLTQGMCNDSVYIQYSLGLADTIRKAPLSPVASVPGRYEFFIPFCGYDTIVKWRVVGKDNSVNHNQTNFPADVSSWMEYRCVRGYDQNSPMAATSGTPSTILPFSNMGDFKCQIVYDSAELAATYKPGAITQIRFPVASNVANSMHNRFVLKMCNVNADFAYNTDFDFYSEFMKTVYDSSLVITQNANTYGTINLQDTFFYAGKGLAFVVYCDNLVGDPAAVSVRTFNAVANSVTTGSLHRGYNASYGFDVFNSAFYDNGEYTAVRPNFTLKVNKNQPLLYDCGISGFIHPNDTTPANAVGNNDVVVTLKNYGAQPINGVRIYYSVDNGAHQYFDWSGTLAPNATINVTINTTQTYNAGYHEMLAWVDDSVLTAGVRYRDHEPFNDTLWTRFITCNGPMSGVRVVGGSTPDYQTLGQLLYALSQCGVDGPLTVKLAPGYYTPHTFPTIPGVSASNYVQFEPLSSAAVTFVSAMADTALVNSLVNLQQARFIRFKDINFWSNCVSNPATYLVRLGTNSVGCQFINCWFNEVMGGNMSESYMAASALLYSGGADSLVVRGCHFNRGNVGLSLVGPAQDNKAHGNSVLGNFFSSQGTNGAVIRNQVDPVVDSNTFNNVYANSSYVLLLQDCDGGSRVTRNTVYVTSGASCIGATNFFGTASNYAVIANNMLVCADDGQSNMLTTPLNIITADYAKVVFNAIKMTAPSRNGIAAATFGGGVLSNSHFYNNIVACFDTVNFAFNYIPTEGASNYIGYNIYYSRGPMLNKYNGINCLTFANWTTHCSMDGNSQNVNPAFLNSTITDLRSYSQNVKNHAVPIPEVTNDMFGTVRDATNPCVGAFEFSALPYDFEIIEFIEPFDVYCEAPQNAPITVVLKNSGVNAFDPSTSSTSVQLAYSRTTTPGVMTPGFSGNIIINRVIPALDTIIFHTGQTLPYATNGMNDTTYHLYVWLTSSIDPNPANDTSSMTVTSRYHAPAPDSISVTSDYGTPATITATSGLQTWYSNVYTASTAHHSEVYWYLIPQSTDHIWRGNTLVTSPLYYDTIFYIRQKRDFDLVKITEVQIKQNMPGVTYPMPLWMNSATAFAVELTNVGDYPANLLGDSLITVGYNSTLNNKIYAFPNVTIQPGQSLVLQYRAGINNVDSTKTLGTVTYNANQNQNFGLIYRHNGHIEDAVAFNDITTHNNWVNRQVPATVWQGGGISLPDSIPTAGVYRTGWPTNPNNLIYSYLLWQRADESHKMTLGTPNNNLIRYHDNGCYGDPASVRVHLINLPNVDMALDNLNIEGGCGLGQSPLTFQVHNRGAYPSGQLVFHYRIDGHPQYAGQALTLQTGCDTLAAGVPASSTISYTFDSLVDFTVASASVDFDIKIWVEKVDVDNTGFNDTINLSITSLYMPGLPNVESYDTVQYDGCIALQSVTPPTDSLAWYDRNMNPLDTCNVFHKCNFYEDDTFYVTSFGASIGNIHVGTLASLSPANNYPSPYNPNKKYVKEQYLFLASDLINAGHGAGPIQTLSFYLDTIIAAVGQYTLTDYVISMGTTSQNTFTSNNNWQPVSQVYSVGSLTLSNSAKGWITHNLDVPFHWNGTDNIVVQITRSISNNITQGARTRYTAAGANKVLFKNDNTSSVVDFTGNGSRSGNRPDIIFGFVDYGCEGPSKPVYVTVVNVPPSDAALGWPEDMGGGIGTGSGSGFTSCDSTSLNVSLHNYGVQSFNTFTIDYWIDSYHGVYNGNTTVASDSTVVITVAKYLFTPGRHSLRLAVNQVDDTVRSNDTISRIINVRFCAGTYPIGNTGIYQNFTAAIDTLMNAGVDGPVVFAVQNGTYVEQLTLGKVDGVSNVNTVTFTGDPTDVGNVVLRYAPVAATNHVIKISGAEYIRFRNMTFNSRGTGNYNNVIAIDSSSDVRFSHVRIAVKGTVNNNNANGIVIGEGVHALYVDTSIIDSGYYAIRSIVTRDGASDGVYITKNQIRSFTNTALYLRKVDDVYVVANNINTASPSGNRAFTGVFIAEHNGPVTVERNNIVLADNFAGVKQGIKIINVNGSSAMRSHVSNNMCAMVGSGGTTTAGIMIDSSTFLNAYYNTSQVYINTNGTAGFNTKAMHVGTTSSNVSIMNNILSNLSGGYPIFVQNAANIENINYNDYWVERSERICTWGATECYSLTEMRATNGMDNNSMNEKPYFRSNTDLHLSIGTFCERAQYNTEVPLDIDDSIRPQIPNPCMGAHEFQRKNHNIAIMEIHKPQLQVVGIDHFTDNIEGDTLWVVVSFTNDGTSTESNLSWWAEVKGRPDLHSSTRYFDEMLPQDSRRDSNYIVMPLGVYDSQVVAVYFPLANDSVPENNYLEKPMFLDPAYNFRAQSAVIHDESNSCRMQNTQVSVVLTNNGRKTFPAGWQVPVGFQVILQTTGIVVPTLPVQWEETLTLPVDVEPNASVTLDLNQTANLYPTNNAKDIQVRARAWVKFQYDWKPSNDTSSYTTQASKYTPSSPVGIDLHIPYATWDTIFASQTDIPPTGAAIHRNIMWYRDSTDSPFFTANNYNRSCWWETPQYFHDSTYFLACVSQAGCTSYYSPVSVYLNPRVPVDMAVLGVEEPVGTRVYMTQDSVKLRLINYGSQTMTNIPVVYQFYNKNHVLLQEVTEVCTASIAPDSEYVFRFDSLINIPTWGANEVYYLRVWTDMPNENVRLNDTLREESLFYAIPDNQYIEANVEDKVGFDITRVAWSSLDNRINPAGHNYINFTNAGSQNGVISTPLTIQTPLPDYGGTTNAQSVGELRALHVVKSTVDTMIVECRNSDRSNDYTTKGWLSVWVDINRDGEFNYNPDSIAVYPLSELLYSDTITSGIPDRFLFSLPPEVRTGYMRMRIIAQQNTSKPCEPDGGFQFGCIHDYLLYVEDHPVDIDLCASRIVSPNNQHIGGHTGYNADTAVTVTFQIANKGLQTINAAQIDYSFTNAHENTVVGSLQWTGSLDAGQSAVIDLPARVFAEGVTDVVIAVSTLGDTNAINDTILYQYYRAPIKTLVFSDDFERVTQWFIPRGYSPFTQNLWQIGKSRKPNIMACVSDSCILTTNVSGLVNVYSTGNVSYAYTPIFDIATIRPDTLELWVARDMAHGHLARIEFCDYLGRWTAIGNSNDTLWYTTGMQWDTVSPGYSYSLCRFPLSKIASDFQQRLQLRLVYLAEHESPACDGVAIDNFVVGRARRGLDVGVIAITYPTHPKFGQTINPRVVIKNYGLDTLYSIDLAYLPYGVNLAKVGTYTNEQGLMPGSTDIFEFSAPFTVMNDFPDTFQICAYTTVNMDLYPDNDSVCSDFYLSPLDNDMGMVSFVSPLDRTIAGDSITVTVRLRNFGQAPAQSATVTYIYNESFTVTENINFVNSIGHDLESFEYFNYSFQQKFRASMGMMNIRAYVSMNNDDYLYNDTIFKNFLGLSAITDLSARGVIVDKTNSAEVKFQVIIDNIGARAANDFKIGLWYYNDTSTRIEHVYHANTPLPALSTLTYLFPEVFPNHDEYYNVVTAYVHCDEDNDNTNDTTTNIVDQITDLRAVRVIVEENRYDSCRVRMEVENVGNINTRADQYLQLTATVNGKTIKTSFLRSIMPGEIATFEFNKTVPKSPTRTYVGSGKLQITSDHLNDNDQTSVVDVVNYFEGVPLVSEYNGMILQQNYPNPFNNSTRIDFTLPTSANVRFFVMDGLGRLVYQSEDFYNGGEHSINFSDTDLSTGVYYYGIEVDGTRLMRRMVLKR